MIKLETEFTSGVGGYSQNPLRYSQIKRSDTAAIYQRFYDDGKHKDYEVFKIKVIPAGTMIFNKKIEEDTEQYAVTSSWGRTAWTYGNIVSANRKFDELMNVNVEDVEETPHQEVNNSIEDVIGGEVNKIDNDTTTPQPVKRRGRTKAERPELKIPNKDKFTMIDLETENINTSWTKPLIYLEIKQQIKDGKVKEVGKVDNTGKRGKAPVLYSIS